MTLPSELEMQLLLCVAHTERTGREVARLYEAETGRSVSYGTVYSTFRRLKKQGWVEVREEQDEDGPLKHFRATGEGMRSAQECSIVIPNMSWSLVH